MEATAEKPQRPPRDNLFRVISEGGEVRSAAEGEAPVLHGHFARFNEWAEIDSAYEGHFMERFAPGAFAKTFQERTPKVLFQHGHDLLGEQQLGTVRSLTEDDIGAAYEVDLFPGIPELLMEGLRAGAYGMSFRFKAHRESIDDRPEPSEQNPEGLPERTVIESAVPEFSPVTFPAYEGTTAGVRSMTDHYLFEQLVSDPERFRKLVDYFNRAAPEEEHPAEEKPDGAAADPHPVSTIRLERRTTLERSPQWRLP